MIKSQIPPGYFDNFNFMQNSEFLITPTSQYLAIQKNASSYVADTLKSNFPPNGFLSNFEKTPNLISWSVIRDPYERFISGLAYDLNLHFPKPLNLDLFFSKIDIKSLFLGKQNHKLRNNRRICHTHLQILYLFNRNVDFYVDVKDLDIFLRIHFKNPPQNLPSSNKGSNKGDSAIKELLKNYIESNSKLKDIIYNYLSLDYYLIDELYNNSLIWGFQQGKIF